MKTVDVIIPTYKPGKKFIKQQRMLQMQTYPIHRIIIVNTEAEYFDREIISDYDNVLVTDITADEFDHGATRNLGVSQSTADYFLLMTDDAIPRDEHLVEKLVEAMEQGQSQKVAAVYGRQLATAESSEDEKYSRNFNYPARSFIKTIEDLPRLGIKTYFESNVCCLYRRDVFDELKGFISHTIFNEDMIYCCSMLKAGFASMYCAEASVYHSHNYTGLQQLRRNFDLGVSQADNPDVFGGIRSEGEGLKLVKGNACMLLKKGRLLSVMRLIWISGCKYLGFRLGKNYRRLPQKLIMKLTMNKHYWK
ncbi:glycosyltransferase family 2 protein [Oribacterium sp. WCC10]|uniref:glycosyltransferase family 2 protein n=1 Tax=Oribacterium sp. WCC10 TaxID=1855343 RepID=UPI0008E70CD4|nr:glycosyltransferase family 2 protein [Oribacterium sp. WCC10]SFG40098.1 rhamnosyltransferase [Oribacterium sp. WCC10]